MHLATMRAPWAALTLCAALSSCTSRPSPVTQVLVAVTSDFTPQSELSRIEIRVSRRDGSDVTAMREFSIVATTPKPGQKELPLTFSVTKGSNDSFLLVVTGYGPLGPNGTDAKVVEQRAIATFERGKSLLLQIFLGRVCMNEFCDDPDTQVCYPADMGAVRAGECGRILALDSSTLKALDVRKLPDLAQLPKGVKHVDGGTADAASDAEAADAGTRGTGGATGDAGSGGQGGVGGAMTPDPCATAHGGCDPLVTCSPKGSIASCGACPSGYKDTNGDGTACKDIDECATSNGGCGSATSYTCKNNIGAAPTCTLIGSCSATNVCTADYPCQILGASYTCRGQFADWPPSDVPPAFTDNGDGTVTDSRGGLTWQQTVDPIGYAWLDAKNHCAGLSLAGSGWRLPTKAELESLVNVSRYSPAMDTVAFPSALAEQTWSSSPALNAAGDAWIVVFGDGDSTVSGPLEGRSVRCVRSSAPVFASSGSGGAPPGRYTDNLDGTVSDMRTKLTWQQAVDPNSYTQANASSYCAALTLASGGWRLPKYSELLTLVDPTSNAPAIDGTAFPNTPPEIFWTSSAYAASTGVAWYVNFQDGQTTDDASSAMHRVRCVR